MTIPPKKWSSLVALLGFAVVVTVVPAATAERDVKSSVRTASNTTNQSLCKRKPNNPRCVTPSPTASATATASSSPTVSASPGASPIPTGSSAPAGSPTPTVTPTPTASWSATVTPSPSVTPTVTATPTPSPTATTTPPVPAAPAQVCGSTTLGQGPASPPTGAVSVPAGNNSGVNFQQANTTYWFAAGVHTLGSGEFAQIIPGNGSTFVGAPGAILDGQGVNRYAFTQHATNVTIRYLTIQGFQPPNNEGVVNHDSGVGWLMEHLTIRDNNGAAVMLGSQNTLRHSCLKDNGQYGFNSYNPTKGALADIVLDHNEITGNNRDDWETQIPGCGCTGGGKFWDAHHVRITNNWVHHNLSVGIWADQNNYDFLIEGNLIEDNWSHGIFYETSYNAVIRNNILRRNAWRIGQEFQARGDNFPIGSIYISESGYDARLPAPAGATDMRIENNVFDDNWGGVVLWENADRYCGSPANTSTGYCTLVNPAVANLSTCSSATFGADGSKKTEPYLSDCRWKTRAVRVTHNEFRLQPANVPNCQVGFCGLQAVFSNYGTYPSWSPYSGRMVQEAITFGQSNRWDSNTYVGAWRFNPYETGRLLTLAQWQAAPYGQDAGSTS